MGRRRYGGWSVQARWRRADPKLLWRRVYQCDAPLIDSIFRSRPIVAVRATRKTDIPMARSLLIAVVDIEFVSEQLYESLGCTPEQPSSLTARYFDYMSSASLLFPGRALPARSASGHNPFFCHMLHCSAMGLLVGFRRHVRGEFLPYGHSEEYSNSPGPTR
jgi:hypothetical protein